MAQIKRVINLEYQAKGLEDIQKRMSNMKPFIGDSDSIKNLEREIQELQVLMGKSPEGIFDPDLAEQLRKKYTKVLNLEEKARVEMIKLKDEDAALSLESFNQELENVNTLIEAEEKLQEVLAKKYITRESDDSIKAGTKQLRNEVLREAVPKVLKENEEMVSVKGRSLTDPSAFIDNMKKLDSILKDSELKQSGILQKMRDGKILTDDELLKVQEILTLKNAQADKNEQIKINAKEVVNQYSLEKRLLQEEQVILEEQRDLILTNSELKMEALKDQQAGLQQARKDFAPTESSMGYDEEGLRMLQASTTVLKGNTAAVVEHSKETAKDKEELKKLEAEQRKAEKATKNHTKATKEQTGTLGKAVKQVFNYGIAFTALKKIYRETISTIKNLDSALTEMSVVTSMTRKEAWQLVPTFQNIAKETGFASTEIAKLSTVYFRQGRELKDVIELTTVAAKAARIAGISAQESADYLTSAVNGFGLAAKEAINVSDKFAALAASSASSYEELATGLSKFAAQANIAGMSIDFSLGLLAKGVETTREAPETIGTALKTVIARMRELTDLGKTFEDGMNVNRVETALRQVGIQLIGTNGQFRDMQDVLTDVGNAWETLNTNQRASVAVALAGTRQQSRLIAIMNDFERTLELVDIAQYSQGATMSQHMEYMESMAAATTSLQNAWQKFITTVTDSEVIISVVSMLANVMDKLAWAVGKTAIGKNLFSIIFATVVVMKSWNVVTGIAIKLGLMKLKVDAASIPLKAQMTNLTIKDAWALGLKNTQQTKSILLDKLKSLSLVRLGKNLVIGAIKWAAYWIAALGAVGLVIAGFAAIGAAVFGVYTLIAKNSEKNVKRLKKERAELQKNVYETTKHVSELKKLGREIDKINSKVIKVQTDFEELDSLMEQVAQIEKEKKIKLTAKRFGEVDVEKTLQNLEDYWASEERVVLKNLKSLLQTTGLLYSQQEATKQEVVRSYSDAIVAEYENKHGRIADEEREFFESYLRTQVESNEKEIKNAGSNAKKLEEIYTRLYNNTSSNLQKFNDSSSAINDAKGTSEKVRIFSDIIAQLEKEGKDDLVKAYKETFAEISYVADSFGKDIGAPLENIIEKVGATTKQFNDFSNLLQKYGYDTKKVLESVEKRTEDLMAMNPTLTLQKATSMAYSDIASSIKEAEIANKLYEIASGKSILNTSQEADRLNSVMKNLSETQQKFLKGEMSSSDIFSFVDENPDLFQKEGVLERFLLGEDVSGDVISSISKNYENFESALDAINVQIDKLSGKTDKDSLDKLNSLRTDKARVVVAMQYTGTLRGLSQVQYDYNNSLVSYNRLSDLGLVSDSDRVKMLDLLTKKTNESIDTSNEKIVKLKKSFEENTGESWEKYVNIVDGVASINTETFDQLKGTSEGFLDVFINGFNNESKILYDAFNNLRTETVKMEKESADKKIKIYENYFDALDALEDKHERKNSREDIVKQLQRLEGASDERSRQKAKDLKADLNKMDKDEAKLSREENRKSLINTVEEASVKIDEKFGKVWEDFLAAGADSGEALFNSLKKHGLIGDDGAISFTPLVKPGLNGGEYNEPALVPGNLKGAQKGSEDYQYTANDISTVKAATANSLYLRPMMELLQKVSEYGISAEGFNLQALEKTFSIPKDFSSSVASVNGSNAEGFLKEMAGKGIFSHVNVNSLKSPEWHAEKSNKEFNKTVLGYSKGGLVDYTGIAMVHGNRTKPEAFLNANQTEMFANLTRALSTISVDSKASTGEIRIDNITIQTQQLNNKQDFNSAGKVLAEAFGSAINRRGIAVNTKR